MEIKASRLDMSSVVTSANAASTLCCAARVAAVHSGAGQAKNYLQIMENTWFLYNFGTLSPNLILFLHENAYF